MERLLKTIVLLHCALCLFAADCPNFVTRNLWGGKPAKKVAYVTVPVKNVIISHTVSKPCGNLIECSEIVETIRAGHMEVNHWHDIGYNFLVGGDGNVYVGSGWHRVGAHTKGWNDKSIGVAFIGDFSEKLPPPKQLDAARRLFECGISKGELDERYKLIGQRQLKSTKSPGLRLYQEIQRWPHWTSTP